MISRLFNLLFFISFVLTLLPVRGYTQDEGSNLPAKIKAPKINTQQSLQEAPPCLIFVTEEQINKFAQSLMQEKLRTNPPRRNIVFRNEVLAENPLTYISEDIIEATALHPGSDVFTTTEYSALLPIADSFHVTTDVRTHVSAQDTSILLPRPAISMAKSGPMDRARLPRQQLNELFRRLSAAQTRIGVLTSLGQDTQTADSGWSETNFEALCFNLERLAWTCIHIADFWVLEKRLGMPSKENQSFEILFRSGGLSQEMARRLRNLGEFRGLSMRDPGMIDQKFLTENQGGAYQPELEIVREFVSLCRQAFSQEQKESS